MLACQLLLEVHSVEDLGQPEVQVQVQVDTPHLLKNV
jgi:hypothetical protein